jgi:competence CoiA-like predicted nuclease
MLSLGAINKITGEYTHPKYAKKIEEFICPECKKDLILCQGQVRIHHYRHKVDSIHPCNHYNNPGETALHKDAKELMKTILSKFTHITMKRKCSQCLNHTIPIEIKTQNDNTSTELEYTFNHSGNPKIADVVYLQKW